MCVPFREDTAHVQSPDLGQEEQNMLDWILQEEERNIFDPILEQIQPEIAENCK